MPSSHTIEDFFQHDVVMPVRHFVTGEEQYYRRANEIVDEVIEARMLLGLHFRAAEEDGADMGRKIARQIRRDTDTDVARAGAQAAREHPHDSTRVP